STQGTQINQIALAVSWLRKNYREPLRIDVLAQQVNMAESTFNRHFRRVTTLSPLQFQKRLRLYEAQRLMLTADKDAASAALDVGYESTAQFSREYKREFGESPHRDVRRLLAAGFNAGAD
ncbi:MAG: AraC family transcriptional regulator, partial [Desulfovibrio sp.]|nr:AraC family transcriptional regulator [Desulfovibrio sp.]